MEEYNKDPAMMEKGLDSGSIEERYVSPSGDKYHFEASDLDQVQRKLKQRHVQMIAIAGTLGTGLFLGSGGALRGAGPLGALIAYALVGTVAYSQIPLLRWGDDDACPDLRDFSTFCRWVDPALGFAVGWNYFYTQAITVPVEITAATILLTFWDDNSNHLIGYTALICVAMCAINIFGVQWFGESEFFFAIIKLSMITGLIICGLVIDLGGGPDHERIGFRFWKHPGAIAPAGLVLNINTDRFLAVLSVIVQAAFSFQGMELVAIAASETKNPRHNIAKAVRRVFYRIIIFYILGLLIIGMCVSSDDPALLQDTGTAAESPFVIAINRAGIKVLPHVINAGVFTSAFSAGNSFLFCASRILYGLALRGQAPRVLTYCTKSGLPIASILASSAFAFLAFMNVAKGAETVFNWFVNLSTVAGFFSWWAINLTYARFHAGMKAQGRDLTKNIYHNRFQPYVSYWGIFWTTLFILINGFTVFFEWATDDFLIAYINVPIFLALYFSYKIFKRSKFWKTSEMDFTTGIPSIEETEFPDPPPTTILGKIAAFLF